MNQAFEFKNLARRLKSPLQVQKFVKEKLKYNKNSKPTLYSALTTLIKKEAHCLEATFLIAAIMEHLGFPPLCISFESQDGLDHVIYIYKQNGLWGSIAKSRDHGLHGRAPKYKTIKSLALSYVEPYIDSTGKITAYQVIDLDKTKSNWRFSKRNVWLAETYMLNAKHIKVRMSKKKYNKILHQYKTNGPIQKGKHWW